MLFYLIPPTYVVLEISHWSYCIWAWVVITKKWRNFVFQFLFLSCAQVIVDWSSLECSFGRPRITNDKFKSLVSDGIREENFITKIRENEKKRRELNVLVMPPRWTKKRALANFSYYIVIYISHEIKWRVHHWIGLLEN